MWNDESISPSLIRVTVSYFAIGLVAVMAIALYLILGFPPTPLRGEWPTHGWYFQIVDVIMMVVAVVLVGSQSEVLIKVAFGFMLGATGFELYSLLTNVAWIAYYFQNTLSTAARAHQSLLHTGSILVILVALVFFHFIALNAIWHVVLLVPDLKILYNLGTVNAYGDLEDDDEEEEEVGVADTEVNQ